MTRSSSLIYFDNSATSFPKPRRVARAITDFLQDAAVNPGRSGFDLSLEAGNRITAVRRALGVLFANPAADPNRTIFCANATEALNLALRGLCRPGDHVVATVMDHNSVLRPLTMMQRKPGRHHLRPGTVRRGRRRQDPDELAKLIRPETRLVVMTHASNVCGTLQPVAEVGRICREKGVAFLIDAAQTAGLVPVDMEAMAIDAVAFTGHKSLLGPTGTGGLVVGPDVDIASTRWGGTGVRSAEASPPAGLPLPAGSRDAEHRRAGRVWGRPDLAGPPTTPAASWRPRWPWLTGSLPVAPPSTGSASTAWAASFPPNWAPTGCRSWA